MRAWDEPSFVLDVSKSLGAEAARVVEDLFAWSERRHLRRHFEDGAEGQVWFQIDDAPVPPQYTISIRTRGDIVFQFQHMKTPFGDEASREELRLMLNGIQAVKLEAARGRPSVSLNGFVGSLATSRLLAALDGLVEKTRAAKRSMREQSGGDANQAESDHMEIEDHDLADNLSSAGLSKGDPPLT